MHYPQQNVLNFQKSDIYCKITNSGIWSKTGFLVFIIKVINISNYEFFKGSKICELYIKQILKAESETKGVKFLKMCYLLQSSIFSNLLKN